jgi:hypothetical protein
VALELTTDLSENGLLWVHFRVFTPIQGCILHHQDSLMLWNREFPCSPKDHQDLPASPSSAYLLDVIGLVRPSSLWSFQILTDWFLWVIFHISSFGGSILQISAEKAQVSHHGHDAEDFRRELAKNSSRNESLFIQILISSGNDCLQVKGKVSSKKTTKIH